MRCCVLSLALLVCASLTPERASAAVPEPIDDPSAADAAFFGLSLSHKLNDSVRIHAFGAGAEGAVHFGVGSAGFDYHITSSIALTAEYMGFFQKRTETRVDPYDHRFRGAAAFTHQIGALSITHRSRVEHRWRDVGNGWRYRPSLHLAHPVHIGDRVVTPYVAAEGYYEVSADRWTLTTVQGGFSVPIGKNLSVRPGYMRVLLRGADDLNIGTLIFGYRF